MSTVQIEDAGWQAIVADERLKRARERLSFHELRLIIDHARNNHPRGVLGFVKYGDREWSDAEINALRAVAGLLAQLQARVDAEERLRYLAYHDELTDVANRRSLIDHLTERLQPEQPGPVGLIFMDVDRLKALNSFFGHAAGDQYLQTLANRLHERVDPSHLLARLGGDEFVLVMSGTTDEVTARAQAEELRAIANEPILVGGEEVAG